MWNGSGDNKEEQESEEKEEGGKYEIENNGKMV